MNDETDATNSRSTRLSASDLHLVKPFVDGEFLDSQSQHLIEVRDPTSGKVLTHIPDGCSDDVNRAVRSARRTFDAGAWRTFPPSRRKAVLLRWADLIEANAAKCDLLDALEMGKPVGLAAFNARAAARFVRYQAEAVDKWTGEVLTSDVTSTVIQKKVPRGVVAAITPWNFPTYNAVLKVAPALAAGNSVVLKPSELASQTSVLLAQLALKAGVPAGVFNIVPGRGGIVGRALAEHLDVNMIAFTGSTLTGKLIMKLAGASNMKAVSAECGGKSPQIVFADCEDLDAIAAHVARTIITNQGQVCSAGSRLLVQAEIEEELVSKVVSRTRDIVIGDPQEPTTTFGPLASAAQLTRVLDFIEGASSEGADLISGGTRIREECGGYFIEPTVFVNVPERSQIANEEVFGPVLSVFKFDTVNDAIRLARTTCYGLAAYVWTSRIEIGFKVANALDTGVTALNATAPRGEGAAQAFSGEPFGCSGVGVEGGMAGFQSYMRRQTVWLNHG